MPPTKRTLIIALIAGWFVVAMKCFLPALLIYFLVWKPLIGEGYGLNYTFFYLVIFCPAVTVTLVQKFMRKKQERDKTV